MLVASFTRAAAKEIASRDIEVAPNMVGTIHSLCYHALRRPELAVKHLKDWNAKHPYFALKTSNKNVLDETAVEMEGQQTVGDKLMSRLQLFRAKMVSRETWPRDVAIFADRWERWKKEMDVVDFTDLLEIAFRDLLKAPGEPAVIFLDEAQDCNPLQLALIRKWGLWAEWWVLCGDDDQVLYRFTGASAKAFLEPPAPDELKNTLKQSYRVPRAVHARAQAIVTRISRREPKEYKPRDADGRVLELPTSYKEPEEVVGLAMNYARQGRSVMLLTSCAYMLDPIKSVLRALGAPFHNPYRRHRGDWNPLRRTKDGTSASQLLLSFLSKGMDKPYWNVPNFINWAKHLKVGDSGLVYNQGNKAIKALAQAVKDGESGLHTCREVFPHVLAYDAREPALKRDLTWFKENLKTTRRKTIEYPMAVLKHHGREALEEEPRITIGTIHSVKGGEADVVFLAPDISYAAWDEAEDSITGQDALHRVFYVGMTRTKHELILLEPAIGDTKRDSGLYVEV